MKNGRLLVISGPSGAGKSSVVKEIRAAHPDMYFSVSATTRGMRESDIEGVTYSFKTREEFEALAAEGYFYEYAEYSGNYYGSPKTPVEQQLAAGTDVILEIDVQGALQVREKSPDAILIFILPPSGEVLRQRLSGRGDTAAADIEKRLARARDELKAAPEYDYIVVNDALEQAVAQVEIILTAERLRAKNNLDVINELEESL